MTENRCPRDNNKIFNNATICEQCSRETRVRLAEIPPMWIEAGAYLVPGRSGNGGSGSRSTHSDGIGWMAMGFRAADEILPILEEWERTVRVLSLGQVELDGQERQGEVDVDKDGSVIVVTRPRLDEQERPIIRTGTIQERVEGACAFLMVHARWLTAYEGAPDWVEDVAKIHGQGMTATRQFMEKVTRIKCPTSLEVFLAEDEIGYEYCGEMLTLGKDPLSIIECKRCRTEWTTLFLVRVALETPSEPVWMDSEAIGSLLGITAGQVARVSKADKRSRKGKRGEETYNLAMITELRGKAI